MMESSKHYRNLGICHDGIRHEYAMMESSKHDRNLGIRHDGIRHEYAIEYAMMELQQ